MLNINPGAESVKNSSCDPISEADETNPTTTNSHSSLVFIYVDKLEHDESESHDGCGFNVYLHGW